LKVRGTSLNTDNSAARISVALSLRDFFAVQESVVGTERPLGVGTKQVCFLTLSRPMATVVTTAAHDPSRKSTT